MSSDPRGRRPNAEMGPLHEAADSAPVAAGFPIDHSREVPALAALHRRGFVAEFQADGEVFRIAGTDVRLRPEDVRIRDYYRFEGTSDPDDMSVIYAMETRDGTRGTLTDAFGAYADAAIGALIERVPVEPFTRRRPWRPVLIGAALGAGTVIATMLLTRRGAA